jgi:quercetin dioxygenase-like cupin family protein
VAGKVTVVPEDAVPKKQYPGGTWSKLLISSATVEGNHSTLGHSFFPTGAATAPIVHDVEEVCLVTSGQGELRTDVGAYRFQAGAAIHIPAGVWHSVVNTGREPVTMVFGFPAQSTRRPAKSETLLAIPLFGRVE